MIICPYCDSEALSEERGDSHAVTIPARCEKCGAWELNSIKPNHPWERITGWSTPGGDDDYTSWLYNAIAQAFHLGQIHMVGLIEQQPGESPKDSLAPSIRKV